MKIIPNIKEQINTSQRWCVYSHFDKNNIVQDYVLNALKKFKDLGIGIIFVSTNPDLNSNSIEALQSLTNTIILRENIGYDFGSYKTGIQFILANFNNIKQITICNDSIFGPIFELNSIYENSLNYDIYGLTDSIDHNYHLQSYFIIFNVNALTSNSFSKFWNNVELLDQKTPNFKQKIILDYEVGSSQFFMKEKLNLGCEFGLNRLIQHALKSFTSLVNQARFTPGLKVSDFNYGNNPTHQYWKPLIELGFPFIKRELLTLNPTNTNISDWPTVIESNSNYDPILIINALYSYFDNDDFFYLSSPTHTLSKSINADGLAKLAINDHLKKWEYLYHTPEQRDFYFDEAYYLNTNLDVKAALERNEIISGLEHFMRIGYSENRRFTFHASKA